MLESILIVGLVTFLIVFLDQKDWEWQERRKQHELDLDSANRDQHYGSGRHFERDNRTD